MQLFLYFEIRAILVHDGQSFFWGDNKYVHSIVKISFRSEINEIRTFSYLQRKVIRKIGDT